MFFGVFTVEFPVLKNQFNVITELIWLVILSTVQLEHNLRQVHVIENNSVVIL